MVQNRVPISARTLRNLLRRVDDLVYDAGYRGPEGRGLTLVIVGGAALMVKWEICESFSVDILAATLPPEVTQAVRAVATETGMAPDWMNNDVGVGRDSGEHISRLGGFRTLPLLAGRALRFEIPPDDMLLSMKMDAGRDRDYIDTVRLAFSSARTSLQDLMELCPGTTKGPIATDKTEFVRGLAADAEKLQTKGVTLKSLLGMSDSDVWKALE